jgi:hypothetical protein
MSRIYILCSESSSGLGWPESAHATLEAAQQAAARADGHTHDWTADPDSEDTWHTLLPDDWMVRAVELDQRQPPILHPAVGEERIRELVDRAIRDATTERDSVRALLNLSPAETERLLHLLHRADAVWGDPATADGWVRSPLTARDNRSPASLAIESEAGLHAAIRVLMRLEHGVYI